MGTNYYEKLTRKHLGKSSAGWCFTLHIYPKEGINTLNDLMKSIKTIPFFKPIVDEYGKKLSKKEFLKIVTERSWPERDEKHPRYKNWEQFLQTNRAELGPNNLLRHKIDRFCIGHGEGTWDYCIGDFS